LADEESLAKMLEVVEGVH